jgi:hypothetical protein
MGFDPEKPPGGSDNPDSTYKRIYLQLRERIWQHVQQQSLPVLGLSPRPVGAYSWQPGSDALSAVREEDFVQL